MKKLKLGIIGVSNHFLKRCRIPLEESTKIEVIAIASRDINKAKSIAEKYHIPHAYGNYQELLTNNEIEAVYIPLPNHLHREWIMKAADAGKHILCEKPLSLNTEQAKTVINYTEKKGVKLMEAFMYRFHPQWIKAKQLLDSGELGKIISIHTFFGYNNTDSNNIRNIKEYGGGAMLDIGCYAISVARFLSSLEPKRAHALINQHKNFGTDSIVSGILDFDYFQSSFTVSTEVHPYQKVEVFCSQGRLVIEIPFNTFQDVEIKISVTNYIGTREIKFPATDQYQLMFDAFADSIIHKNDLPTSIEDAINNMKVIDAIFTSNEKGSWVTID